MPEMSVVRFTESDVIVASSPVGPMQMALRKYGDGTPGNGYVEYMGRHYGSTQSTTVGDVNAFYEAFNANNDTSIGDSTSVGYSSGYIDFHAVLGFDNSDTVNTVDGVYEWNGREFAKQ